MSGSLTSARSSTIVGVVLRSWCGCRGAGVRSGSGCLTKTLKQALPEGLRVFKNFQIVFDYPDLLGDRKGIQRPYCRRLHIDPKTFEHVAKYDYVHRHVGFQQADLADERLLNIVLWLRGSNNPHQRSGRNSMPQMH